MRQRLKKISRIIKVQQHLHKNAEIRLVELQRREEELKTSQEELIQTMGDRDVLHGLFTDVLAKRLKALAVEERQTQAAIVAQKYVALEKAMQVKRTEKLFSKLEGVNRKEEGKKDLLSILETISRKGNTSLP